MELRRTFTFPSRRSRHIEESSTIRRMDPFTFPKFPLKFYVFTSNLITSLASCALTIIAGASYFKTVAIFRA